MNGGEIVGMILFLVIGIVLVSHIFFRSREKQLMIEKGLSYEQMVELLRTKRDPHLSLKIGIITVFVGLGLGAGFLMENLTDCEEWMPFFIVTFCGLGFVTAFLVSRMLKNSEKN
jgi:hypothetical protein